MASSQATTTSFFLIAKKHHSDLITSSFTIGEGQEQAVFIFTDEDKAQQYVQQAQWIETETVAELHAAALLKWLMEVERGGVGEIVVDPDRGQHTEGVHQRVIQIRDLMNSLGPAIHEQLTSGDFSN